MPHCAQGLLIALTATARQLRLNERLKQFSSHNNSKSAKYSRGQRNYFQPRESTLRLNLDQSKILKLTPISVGILHLKHAVETSLDMSKKNADEIQIAHPAKSTLLLK